MRASLRPRAFPFRANFYRTRDEQRASEFTTDEAKLPVVISFRTKKGEVARSLASVQKIEPEVAPQPTPAPVKTPLPERTPRPAATPVPYIDNQPLAPELAFDLGERLDYRISSVGQQVATMRLQQKSETVERFG